MLFSVLMRLMVGPSLALGSRSSRWLWVSLLLPQLLGIWAGGVWLVAPFANLEGLRRGLALVLARSNGGGGVFDCRKFIGIRMSSRRRIGRFVR